MNYYIDLIHRLAIKDERVNRKKKCVLADLLLVFYSIFIYILTLYVLRDYYLKNKKKSMCLRRL